MRYPRALAMKVVLISGVAGAVLSGPALALSTAISPATTVPVVAAGTATPNMFHG
jgi:hypothetical protein